MKEKTGLKPIDELVLLARDGNGLAFTALWDRHIDQLRLFIKGMVKNLDDFDVDDICSRSFEKAFRQIGNYDPARSRFTTWLWTIARNTALDFVEQDKRIHPRDVLVSLERESQKDPLEDIPEQAQNVQRNCRRDGPGTEYGKNTPAPGQGPDGRDAAPGQGGGRQ